MEQDAATEATEQAAHTPAPVTPPAGETTEPAAPVEQPAPAPAAQDSPSLFEGTPINPDVLIQEHPELAPLVNQLNAAFTQKTQGVAEQRKQLEALGSVEELEQAVELMTRLSDPNNWPEIHANLTTALTEAGMSPAEAHAEATRAVSEAQAPPATPAAFETDDPELAPFVEALKATQAELAELRASRANEAAAAVANRQREQMLAEFAQQEAAVKTANPAYAADGNPSMDYVYKLGAFHETNLLAAQQDFEAIKALGIQEYLAAKTAGASRTTGPAPAHASTAAAVPSEERTIKDVGEELEEHFRALQAAGELEIG